MYEKLVGKGAVPGSLPKFLKHPLARFGQGIGLAREGSKASQRSEVRKAVCRESGPHGLEQGKGREALPIATRYKAEKPGGHVWTEFITFLLYKVAQNSVWHRILGKLAKKSKRESCKKLCNLRVNTVA